MSRNPGSAFISANVRCISWDLIYWSLTSYLRFCVWHSKWWVRRRWQAGQVGLIREVSAFVSVTLGIHHSRHYCWFSFCLLQSMKCRQTVWSLYSAYIKQDYCNQGVHASLKWNEQVLKRKLAFNMLITCLKFYLDRTIPSCIFYGVFFLHRTFLVRQKFELHSSAKLNQTSSLLT